MSNTWKWIIGIIIIVLILLGLWWWMSSSNSTAPASQPAAAVSSVTTATVSASSANTTADAKIARDSQALSAQIQAESSMVAKLNAKSSATTVSGAANGMNQVISALASLEGEVQVRVGTAKGVTATTLSSNLQGASQQYLLASAAVAKATGLLKTPNTANVQQAESQISSALSSSKSAFASINSVASAVAGH